MTFIKVEGMAALLGLPSGWHGPEGCQESHKSGHPSPHHWPPDRRIIEVPNFSELHIVTGIVSKLIRELIKAFSNTQAGQNIKLCPYNNFLHA